MAEHRPGRRTRWIVVGGAVVVAGSLAAGLLAHSGSSSAAGSTVPVTSAPAKTAKVQRTDLVETTDVAGTLGYGDRTVVKLATASSGSGQSATTGTITGLPAEGTVVARGQSLVEVDGLPSAIVMYGARPMWRTLNTSTTNGPDVQQLEENLVAMGFATAADVTVDQDFTFATKTAVKAWQASLGREETGEVAVGDIVFLGGPVRIASVDAVVGDAASGNLLGYTGTTRSVHVDLDTADADLVKQGDVVSVELADGTKVQGTVAAIGTTATTATSGSGQNATTTTSIALDITLNGEVQAYDESPVTVKLVASRAANVLAVPVKSLVALAEGGYAVERVRDGQTQLVAVTPGKFADGKVEVTGDIAEGDSVVIP